MNRCSHCGSKNHQSFDCTKQGETYVLTPADLAEDAVAQTDIQAHDAAQLALTVAAAFSGPEPMFEPRPRWPGAPLICTAVNLPAFDNENDAMAFHAKHPGCPLLKVWHCEICDKVHYLSDAPYASGASSGHGVHSKYPRTPFVPFMRRSTIEQIEREKLWRPDELPQQPEPTPVKKVIDPIPKPAIKWKRNAGDLF